MKVSVIMMTYNHENFIADAIQGVLKQKTDFTFELIVANDASSDNTGKIIASYRQKYPEIIKDYENINNIGPRFNFIKAYKNTTGNYIAMCEGDDFWTDPLKLQQQFDFLEKNSDYTLTFHEILMIDADGNNIEKDRLPDKDKKDYEKDELLTGPYLPTPTLFFRKFDITNYVAAFSKAFNGDSLLLSILTQKGKTKYLPGIAGSVVRLHSGGVWSSTTYLDRWNHSLNTAQVIFGILDRKRRACTYDNFIKAFEMAAWDADYYQSKKYWLQYNKKYISFLLMAKQYGKTWLIVRRIVKKVIRN